MILFHCQTLRCKSRAGTLPAASPTLWGFCEVPGEGKGGGFFSRVPREGLGWWQHWDITDRAMQPRGLSPFQRVLG